MRRLFITASFVGILLGFANHLFAQVTRQVRNTRASLTGKVSDGQTGEVLAGASVYFPDLKMGVIAGSNGVYKVPNLTEGKYLVEVSYTGYGSVTEQVTVAEGSQKDFVLHSTVV